MLLHSRDQVGTSPFGAASGSQSLVQHVQRNVNTAGDFNAALADELTAPALPPLPGTLQSPMQGAVLPGESSLLSLPALPNSSSPVSPSSQLGLASQPTASTPAAKLTMPTGATPPPERKLTDAETQKINGTAQQLESLMLYQMLKQMWESIPESKLQPTGSGGQIYREMWLEQVANKASQAGGGIGLAKVVERELTDRAKHTFTPEQAAQLRQAA